jgi:hypothetical protein
MSSLFDNLSEELFQLLKGSGKSLILYDATGNKTYEPKKARRVFALPDNLMVSVVEAGDDSSVKLYLSQSTDIKHISKLINTLRQVSTRYNVIFDVRKFERDIKPKDFAFQVNEAMWGSTRTSYQRIGESKLIVRHCRPVAEGIMGARGRNILSIFVETKGGERFRFPETHLNAGRAYARHIDNGGRPHDETSLQIVQLAAESLNLTRVNRYIIHSRNYIGEEALCLRPVLKNRITEVRKTFQAMSRPKAYHKVIEHGLPIISTNLMEDSSDEISRLMGVLQIDINHALAESLMPVALLTLGENMTDKNNLFHGVLTLEDSASLVEALVSEYGHDSQAWSLYGNNIAFGEEAVFEDAKSFLDVMESAYQINENDAVLDYATQWSQNRFANSDKEGFMPAKDREEFSKSIPELAAGIKAVLAGQFKIPEYPEQAPGFSDTNAQQRFYLDLFVDQQCLANVPTLNYVASIVDKLTDGKKLDSAEKLVAGKLIDTLQADLTGGEDDEVEESYYGNDPTDGREEEKLEPVLQHYEDNFDAVAFLNDHDATFVDDTIDAANEDPTAKSYFVAGIAHDLVSALDDAEVYGYSPDNHTLTSVASELFDKHVLPVLQGRGWKIQMDEDAGVEHGFDAGDFVSTDFGPAKVISVDGDIASVEFQNGATRQLHVSDIDAVGDLANTPEEKELSEWFDSFAVESVLPESELAEANFTLPPVAKAAPVNPNYSSDIVVGDRVVHKTYGAGEVVQTNDKMARVKFDQPHSRLPEDRTVSMVKTILHKAGGYRKESIEEAELNELSVDKKMDYFNKAAGERGAAERDGDEGRLARRDRGLSRLLSKTFESVVREGLTEGVKLPEGALDKVFADLKQMAEAALANPEAVGLPQPIGQDDTDEENYEFVRAFSSYLSGELKSMLSEFGYGELEVSQNEAVSGDIGQDLINDVKVDHSDEVDEAEDLDADIHDGMSDEELFHAHKNAWKGRGTMQALDRMDKIKDILAARGKVVEAVDIDEAVELESLLKNAFFRK